MIINYANSEDKFSAELLAKKFNAKVVYTASALNINTLTEDIIVIGNQETNPTYKSLVNEGILVALREDIHGYVLTGYHEGHTVFGVGGFTREGTIGAVYYLFSAQLPLESTNLKIPRLKNMELYTLPLVNNSHIRSYVNDNLPEIIEKANEYLYPQGHYIGYAQYSSGNLYLLINTFGSIPWYMIAGIIAGIIAVIAAIPLISVGLITSTTAGLIIVSGAVLSSGFGILGYMYSTSDVARIEAITEATKANTAYVTTVNSITNEAVANGQLTPEQGSEVKIEAIKGGNKLQESLSKSPPSTGEKIVDFVQNALILGGLGVGGYFLTTKFIIPTLKEKSKKNK